MGLSIPETEQVKSLQVKKGKYSELFYMQNENKTILRIIPDELSYYLCSSDAKDKEMIARMKEKFPNLNSLKIIEKIIQQGDTP